MLLTSGQVSLAISSTIVFIFTTALFLCGYVVQQKTVNDIREAIKPQPRPVHTNLYVPPKPDATPGVVTPEKDGVQIVEVNHYTERIGDMVEETTREPPTQQIIDADEEEGLVQGADGGFLRRQVRRQRKQTTRLNEDSEKALGTDAYNELSSDDLSNSRKAADATGGPGERLSRAARRKLIKDEFTKLAGEDLLSQPNVYKRRRLW